jgi:hypothetical protein
MVNGWKTAYVAAPACEEGEPPEESIVQFQIASAEASYTNHLHFKVVNPEVKFGQENLTLPARYEKQVDLPFDVIGINDGTTTAIANVLKQQTAGQMFNLRGQRVDASYKGIVVKNGKKQIIK